MHGKKLWAATLITLGSTTFASADVLWSNTGNLESFDVFSSAIQSPLLEDGVFVGGAGPFNLTGIKLGYDNIGFSPVNADVLISFWDTIDYNGELSDPVASGQIGSTYRFNFLAAPGAGETGLLSLPGGLLFPDNTFGVIVNFVVPDTTTPLVSINHLFKDIPVTVGSSDGLFGFDFDLNGLITGDEIFQWEDGVFPHANLYMEIQGSVVPEPGSALLAALGGLGLLRRRRV